MPFNDVKHGVWRAMNETRIAGTTSAEKINSHTDTSSAYLLHYDRTCAFFQQDSAVNLMCCFRVFLVTEMWPPLSPELNQSHFVCLCDMLNDKMYSNNPPTG